MDDTKPTERHEEIQFRQLLEEAVSKPGTLMKAYSLFWNSVPEGFFSMKENHGT
jgi:hypothetical protein